MRKYLILALVAVAGIAATTYTITELTANNTPGAGTVIEIYDPTATPKSGKYTLANLAVISDAAYNATTWDNDTTHSPSKNAVRDKFESLSTGGGTTNMMVSTITHGASITPSFAIGGLSTTASSCRRVTFRLTMTGDITTVNAPTGTVIDGDTMVWEVIQDGTGGHSITGWNSAYAFGTDIPSTSLNLTQTASKRDFITFVYNSTATKWYVVGFIKGF